jgi:hypothetical protein
VIDRDVVIPFYLAAKELFHRYEAKPDAVKIVQIGNVWLTWGDFRKVIEAMGKKE